MIAKLVPSCVFFPDVHVRVYNPTCKWDCVTITNGPSVRYNVPINCRKRCGVSCQPEDLSMVSIRIASSSSSSSSVADSKNAAAENGEKEGESQRAAAVAVATALVKFREKAVREAVFEGRSGTDSHDQDDKKKKNWLHSPGAGSRGRRTA